MGEHYWARLDSRRVSRRRFLAGGGVAAAGSAALLAGCGGDSPAPLPAATEAPAATETPTPATRETREATAPTTPARTVETTVTPTPDPNAPRRGGTLRLWKTEEDAGLDPGVFHANNRDLIHSTLTQPMTYQPTKNLFAMDGMVGYEQVDPVTLVWSIRPGMKFHNGDPVDSEAVAFSFGRLAKLKEAFEARGDSTHVRSDGYDFVDSFEATDDLTLIEHWSRPNADALIHRARHHYSFLNPSVVQEQGVIEGVRATPDGAMEDVYSIQELPFGSGSGPYVLTKRDGTGTRVERWPDYHKHTPADDGFVEDGPYIDAWETQLLPDWASAKHALLAGDLDVLGTVSADEVDEFESEHVSVSDVPAGGLMMLGMDGAKLHDRRARQALQKAIDYEGFSANFRPQGGQYAAPISNLLPHYQQLSQRDLQQWHGYDPVEARALWDAAEFEVPIDTIRILASGQVPLWDVSEFVGRSFGETLGIETERVHADGYCHQRRCAPPHGDPDDWLLLCYGSGDGVGTTGTPHDSHLINYNPRGYGLTAFNHSHLLESPRPEIEDDAITLAEMLDVQQAEVNVEDRAVLLTQVQRWILDRAWCVLPLPISRVQYVGVSARLRDHAPDDWANFYDLRRESMWLADS